MYKSQLKVRRCFIMKLEQNEQPLIFSSTQISDIFFSEYLSELPGDYLKIYLYMI